ncbi:MAG: hypothetical protein ACNA8W_12630 [Bradymonadaceae bacterium]
MRAALSFQFILFLGVIALALASGPGCVPELSCLDLGCAYNQMCNAETRQCETISRDCSVSGCPADHRCDVPTGICRLEAVSCRFQPCSSNQVCNTQTGFCQATENCALDGCSSVGDVCDLETGRCLPKVCDEDSACAAGFVCGVQDTCVSGCRPQSGSCPTAQYCRALIGEQIGQCVPQCRENRDCPFGQYCQSVDSRMICLAEPPCTEDSDCRSDEICQERQCREPPCSNDDDCPEKLACHRASGLCLGGDCDEDIFAPNHSRSQAAAIPAGNYANLTLCPGRADWFALDVRSSDVVSLRLERPSSAEVEARLYDGRGRLVAAHGRITSVALLEHVAHRTETLHLEILSADFEETTYTLEVSINAAALCLDDSFEENDHIREATILPTDAGSPTELPLRICGFDDDWFVLPEMDANLGLHVRFRNGPHEFVGRVLTPEGAVFEPRSGESLRIRRLGYGGNYYLHAHSRHGISGSYRMLFDVLEPWQCPSPAGLVSRQTAPTLTAGATSQATLCPSQGSWDIHWYRLVMTEEAFNQEAGTESMGMLTLDFQPTSDMPDVTLTLFEEIDGEIHVVRIAQRDHMGRLILHARLRGEGVYYVRLDSQAAPGRITHPPRYGLLYEWEADEPEEEALEDEELEDE